MRFFYSLLLILSIAIGFSGVAEAISLFPPRPTFPLIPRGSSGGRPTLAPGRVLVQMKPGYSPDRLLNETALARLDRIPQLGVEVLEVPEGQEETLAAALSRRPDVLYAEIDRMSHVSLVPNDPYYSGYLWHLPKIQAPKAWDYTTGDSSVIIAVLDTGVDTNHPELKAKLLTGYNAFTKTSDSMDDQGHGTYVSGLATATSNNGVGVTGVSWGARVLPVKVMDSSGSGPNSTIAAGITWAADNGAKIINLSLGGEGYSQTMHNAVKYASRKGILLLAAMGNAYKEGNPVEYPAAYPEVMAVGAVNYMDARAGYSNTGSHISVAAPGGEILSNTDTDPRNALWSTYLTSKGGYGGADGTSGATPVVAGLAALLWSKAPTYTATEMRQLIERTAVDLGPAGKDNEYGYGRIDAGAAMVWIGGTLPDSIPPRASLTAPTAGALVSGTVTITGTVTDDKALKSFQVQFGSGSSPTAWTNIGAAQTQPVTLGTLASWNTTGLLDGSYTIRVTAVDVAGNSAISLPTTVTVNNSQATLTVKTSVTAAKTGEYVGLSVQSSQPLLSTPRLTVSGGCIAAATIPLNASGGGYVGAYIPPSGTSDCIVTFTATGTDALNRAAQSGSATLQLDLTPPVAQDQTLHIDEDGSIQVTLSATDTSRITYRIVDSPAHGALGVLSGDRITYTPKPNFFGTDRFTFKANDGKWDSAPATVTVTTHKVNDAPVAVNGSAVALPGQAVAATLTGTDIDGDGLAYSVVSPPAHGTLSGTAPDLRYTPNPGYVGSDSFSFRVNDGQADSNVGVFSINVVSPLLVVNSAEAVPGGTATLSLSLTEAAVRVTGLDLRLRVVGPVGSPEIVPTIMPGAQALGWILMPDPSDPLHFTLSGPALSGPAELAKFAFQVPETVAGGTVYTLQAETATLMEEGKPSTEVASLVQPGLFTVEDCGALLKGDGTGNGTLDVADVIFALRIAVDLEQPEPCQHMAADVDSNGVVALDDAVMLLRHIVMGEPLPTQNLGQ